MNEWKKSSYSGAGGSECVEVSGNRVRDSKDPDGPILTFTPKAWSDFLTAIKQGDLD